MSNKEKLEVMALEKGRLYRDTFSSPFGMKVLADLELNFNPEKLSTNDPHTTALKIGAATPIHYIKRRIKDGMA